MRLPVATLLPILGLLVTAGCNNGKPKDTGGGGDSHATDDTSTGYTDADHDGYAAEDGDCNDGDPTIHPGASELCDGIDQNCNGLMDEGFADTDGDGIADCVDTEDCDGIDNNGDGRVDEGFPDDNANGVADCLESEICDGIDNNGDGRVDEGYDLDGDGYTSCGSDTVAPDCNDSDASIHPGGKEVAGDLVDNDCDGLIDEADWNPGDVFITETMNNPYQVPDPDGEWFEIYNDSGRDLILNGMVITSAVSGDWHQVSSSDLLWLAPNEYFVFGINDTVMTNGGVTVDYQYSDITLSNEDDDLILMMGDVVVDEVAWDNGATFPDPQGATMTLDPSAYGDLLNDAGASWCESSFPWATNTDDGSPGQDNEFCWPVADAHVNTDLSNLYTCSTLYLVGSDSYDPDGAAITFDWELVSAPAGSSTSSSDIETSTAADPTFVPDLPGTYTFALTVFNGTSYAEPFYVTVVITERPYNTDPVADGGDDRTYSEAAVCSPVSYGVYYTCNACNDAEFALDASASYDADGDALAVYAWEVTGGTGSGSIDAPSSSSATLTMTGPETAYGSTTSETVEVTLTVTDCMGATGSDVVTFTYECSGA